MALYWAICTLNRANAGPILLVCWGVTVVCPIRNRASIVGFLRERSTLFRGPNYSSVHMASDPLQSILISTLNVYPN